MNGGIIAGVISGSLYTLIAMGLVIIFRCSHSINFAQGDVGAVGAFSSISLAGVGARFMPVWIAVILGILIGAIANLAVYGLYVQFLERRGSQNIYLTLVGTLGVSMILEAVLPLYYGYSGYSLPLFASLGSVRILGVNVPVSGVAIVVSAFVALLAFTLILYKTRVGLLLRMGASDVRLTSLSGVRIYVVRGTAWAVAGGLSAWGVMLYAAYQNITVLSMGTFILYAAVAASWGAFRSVSWTIVGAFATGIVGNIINTYTSNSITNSVALVLLVVAIGIRVWRSRGSLPGAADRSAALVRTLQVRLKSLSLGELGVVTVAGLLIWYFGTSLFFTGLLEQASYTIIALVGVAICLRYGGRLALCSAGVMGIGGYISSYEGLSVWLGALAAVLACAVLGAILGAVTFRMELIYYANITLLITVAVPEIASLMTSYTGGNAGEPTAPFTAATLLGGRSGQALIALLVAIAALGAYAFMSRRQAGRALALVGRDPGLALAVGTRPFLVRMGIEATGLALMGLAGVFWAQQSGVLVPGNITLYNANIIVAGVIIGGGWSIAGVVVGSVVLVGVPSLLSGFSGAWPGAVFGLLLVSVALFAPSGLEGRLAIAYRFLFRRRRPARTPEESASGAVLEAPTSPVH